MKEHTDFLTISAPKHTHLIRREGGRALRDTEEREGKTLGHILKHLI